MDHFCHIVIHFLSEVSEEASAEFLLSHNEPHPLEAMLFGGSNEFEQPLLRVISSDYFCFTVFSLNIFYFTKQ